MAAPPWAGGHITRCLVLADALKRRGWRCAFAVSPETAATMRGLAASGYEVLPLPEEGPGLEAQAIADHWGDGGAILITDHYQRDSMFETPSRRWFDKGRRHRRSGRPET